MPTDERARLVQWLKGILKTFESNCIVITSRPSGYSADELDDKLFGHYDLLSFTPEQTGEFARKWFGDKVGLFLKELERIRTGALSGTPFAKFVKPTRGGELYLKKPCPHIAIISPLNPNIESWFVCQTVGRDADNILGKNQDRISID